MQYNCCINILQYPLKRFCFISNKHSNISKPWEPSFPYTHCVFSNHTRWWHACIKHLFISVLYKPCLKFICSYCNVTWLESSITQDVLERTKKIACFLILYHISPYSVVVSGPRETRQISSNFPFVIIDHTPWESMEISSHCSLQHHCKKVQFPMVRVFHPWARCN